MGDYNGGESSNNYDSHGPDTRSRYQRKPEPLTFPELYAVNQAVYLRGSRGTDPNPYTIYKVLGDGQYRLSRNGIPVGGVAREEDLQTRYP